jgi:poly-beta-1,6-N-acetyl-D-glucosamine synthase
MNISVGVCAYNEEKNLGILLNKLLTDISKEIPIKEIIVVSDGSSDKTNIIIKSFQGRSKKIKAIIRKNRYGKVNAINEIIKKANSDIIIMESADNIPKDGAYKRLIEPFKDESIGIIGGRIVPINKGNGFMTFLGTFMYKLHHEIAVEDPKYGELIAFRNVINKVPLSAVDEECIAMLVCNKGYRGVYCPEAIVYNKTPTNIGDFVKQRRRIYAGHLELKMKYKFHVPTVSNSTIFLQIFQDKPYLKKNIGWIIPAVMLELYSRFLGAVDLLIFKKHHYKWDMACSTKNPQA